MPCGPPKNGGDIEEDTENYPQYNSLYKVKNKTKQTKNKKKVELSCVVFIVIPNLQNSAVNLTFW